MAANTFQWNGFATFARKATMGGLVAGATALVQAAPDGITASEWFVIIAAVVAGYGGVYTISNTQRETPTPATDVAQ